MSSVAQAQSLPRSRWIVSPAFDLLIISGSCLAVFFPLIARRGWDMKAMTILAIVGIVSNGPHLAATWLRVYVDANERRARPVAYIGVPLAITAGVISTGLWAPKGARVLLTVAITWAIWHFAAQCYGLLRIYQKKSGEPPRLAHRWESWLVFAVGLTAVIWRLHYGPTSAFGMKLLYPQPPLWSVWLLMGVVGALVTGVLWDRCRSGVALGGARLVFLASVMISFGVPFMVIKHGTTAFAAAACWHGLQYMGIVWFYNRRRFGGRPAEAGARLVSWVSQPGRGWAFLGLLWLLIGSVYALVEVLFVWGTEATFIQVVSMTWVCLSLSHYWVDGLIWRMRKPQIAATLAG